MPAPTPILLTPLNWGLGHVTRALPLATALGRAAAEAGQRLTIHWASDGDALALLRRERPDDVHHELPGYGVRYPTRSPLLNMAISGPRMLRAIGAEAGAVRALHAAHGFALVVSDNRYGCRVPGVRSLLVTHQLHLPIGGLAGRVAQRLQEAWLGGFDQLIVPDYAEEPRLAGEMSAPLSRLPCRYLGPVSRFTAAPSSSFKPPSTAAPSSRAKPRALSSAPPTFSTVCLLSGPEPTRTQLEEALYRVLLQGQPALLIRGTTAARPTTPPPPNLTVRDMLTSTELRQVLAQAPTIVTRPGYTTVMDLAALGRKAVFVPTPAQPEQGRLGASLAVGGFGVTVAQARLGVPGVLAKAVREVEAMEGGDSWDKGSLGSAAASPASFARDDGGGDALAAWARDEVLGLGH